MSADIAQNLWSLVCSCLNSYWAIHLFPLLIFLKLVAFSIEFNLFTPICFVLFMIMDFPYISHHQVGYSPGGYLLYPRWFLTLYIYPFFQDWLHWWVLILHKTYDHWFVAVSTVTEHFIYAHFWIFSNWFLSAQNSIFLPHLFFLFMIMDFPYIFDHQVGYSSGGYSLSLRRFLIWYIYPFFQDWLHWWVLILHETYDHWSVAVLTANEHFVYSHSWFFLNLLLSSLNSISLPHLFSSLYDNRFPLYLSSPIELLCWWIFIVSDVVLNLYIYPFSQDWLHWWVLIFHKTYDHWSVAVLTVTEHFIYSHSWFFFKLVAFCTEFNLFTLICFVLYMIMDFPYICDHQVGYSPGGYLLCPRWFLTWHIYPFFQDWLHWWVLVLHKTYDHWSVAVSTFTEHFIYSHFWIFSSWLLSALNSIFLPPIVLFSLW